uniref:G_PROTEIN_RECEP_F1_2 domain-containing protein n=1 Tax=Heterorhabditis bacteriophora TaxID=37862 RepID=A0A1I7WMJ8_HETBA
MDNHNMEDAAVREWVSSSYFLYVSVISVSILTLPLLLLSLVSLFKHRKSHYFVCLSSIITGNIVLLDVVQGSAMCKTNAFLVNVSSCFVHWTWVVMYLQRCVCVFFPMRARRNRNLVNGWCAIFGSHLLQAVAIAECVLTFFVPFVLTVLTDISVVVLRRPCRPQFILIPADAIAGCDPPSHDGSYLKIVSRKNIDVSYRIFQFLIFCSSIMFFLVVFSSVANFYHLFCFQADAAAYVLYLLQFPLVPIYIYLLKGDLDKSLDRRAIRRRMDTSCRLQDPSL